MVDDLLFNIYNLGGVSILINKLFFVFKNGIAKANSSLKKRNMLFYSNKWKI